MATKASGEFEAALGRLEEIVKQLDDESIGLEQSVDLFKEAKRLALQCDQLLKRAQTEIDAAASGEVAPSANGNRTPSPGLPFELDDEL